MLMTSNSGSSYPICSVSTLQHRIVGGGRPVQREVGEGVVVDQHRHLLDVARRRLALGQPHIEGDVERPVI